MRSQAVAVLFLVTLSACAAPKGDHFERPWLDSVQMARWEELDAIKEKVNRDGEQPQMQEFEGVGTMVVWGYELQGGPGWEFLRLAYSYHNTSDSNFDTIRVRLEILDPDGELVDSGEELLRHPFGYAVTPNDTYSDVLRVPTHGVHREKGWTWRITCEPVVMKVLPPTRYGG